MSVHRVDENRQSAGRSWSAQGWNHYRITDEFLRLKGLDPGFKLRLVLLELLYRSQSTCVASNEEFCDVLECSKNTLQVFFREGERGDWFKRVKVESPTGICTGRLGLIALKRATDQAVVRPDELAAVEARLRRKERRRNGVIPYRARDPTAGDLRYPTAGEPRYPIIG